MEVLQIQPLKIYLPQSLPHQLPVLLSPARFKVAACGRRWGKTDVGLHACVQGHGPRRGALKGAIDGGEIWWVTRTYKVAAKIWRMLKRSLRDVWTSKLEIERRIELPGGGSVTVKSADSPDDLRGDGLDGVVIDEAAYLAENLWTSVLRPALSDKLGWCLFISSPNGMNWFKKLFDQVPQRRGWESWQLPTADNPLIARSELEDAKTELGPQLFAQEYGAQFTAMEGAIFPSDWFGDSIWFDKWPPSDQISCRICYCDPSLGKTDKSDYSAIVTIAVDLEGGVWVDASIERRTTVKIAQDVVAISRAFNPAAFGIEVNGFQELLADLIEQEARNQGLLWPGVPVINSAAKTIRIRGLTPYLSRGDVHFKRGSRGAGLLVDQLAGFPIAKHDDGPDALAGAVQLAHGVLFGDPIDGDDDIPKRLRAA